MGNVEMTKRGDMALQFYICNNGTTEAVHSFTNADLAQMLTVEADIDILNKMLSPSDENYVAGTIHLSETLEGKGFSTTSSDVWAVKKAQKDTPVVDVTSEQKTATYTWNVSVGLKNGENLIVDPSSYVFNGRDGVTSLKLSEALTSTFLVNDQGTTGRELLSLEIMKVGGEYVDIKSDPTNVYIWGSSADERLKMNSSVSLDSNGVAPPEVETPVYTTYVVKAVYKINDTDIVDFYSTDSHVLRVKNDVTLAQTFKYRSVEDQTAEATSNAPLTANKPAGFTITKYLRPYKGNQAEYDNSTYGPITYTVKDSDGNVPTLYVLNDDGSYSVNTEAIKTNTAYYLEPGVYTVTESIDAGHTSDMSFVSVLPHVDSDPEGTARFTGVKDVIEKITFVNKELRGDVVNTKKDDKGSVLKGATFRLYIPAGVTIEGAVLDSETGRYYLEATSDDNGALSFEKLPYGSYTLEETSTPDGYAKNDTQNELPKTITINDAKNIHEFVFTNIQTKAQVTLTKKVGIAQSSVSSFSAASGDVNFATFTLQRTTKDNPTEKDWQDVTSDYFGTEVSTELKVSNVDGTLSLWMPATDSETQKPYKYRFKETITNGHEHNDRYTYYPVEEGPAGTFTNKPNATTAVTLPKTMAEGGTADFVMYNRRTVRINVEKHYYTYNENGVSTETTRFETEFALYSYKGSGTPSSMDDLQLVSTKTANSENTAANASWTKLPLYDGADRITYYVIETSGEDGYVWRPASNQQGELVTFGEGTSAVSVIKMVIPDETTSTGFSTRQNNYRDMVRVGFLKKNAVDTTQGVPGSKITIYTNPACTADFIAKDARTGAELKDIELNSNGTTPEYVFLEEHTIYYYKETTVPTGFNFANCTKRVTGTLYGKIDPADEETLTYTVFNKPDSELYLYKKDATKDATGKHADISGAKYAVYKRTANADGTYTYTQVTYDGSPLEIAVTNGRTEVRLPAGDYWLCETTVPQGYLNPNSEAACAEYNRLDPSGGDNNHGAYVYDAATGKTFVQITVPQVSDQGENVTCSFTFYNIPNKGNVTVQKFVDGVSVSMAGFGVAVFRKSDNTQIGNPKTTGTNGKATFTGLAIYDDNGNKITYSVVETGTANWTGGANGDLANSYYKVYDGQEFTLEPGVTVTKGIDNKTLRVENESYISITATKERFDGWQHSHGGISFPMKGVEVGLYRRVWTEDGSNPWVYQNSVTTGDDGTISFDKLVRTGVKDGERVRYEYALVERASADSTYFPYQNGFKKFLTDDEVNSLSAYNALTLLVGDDGTAKIGTDKKYDLTKMFNSNHWVQFHVTKWKDKTVDRESSLDSFSPPTDANGSYEKIDDCIFTLYRFKLAAGQTKVTFNRDAQMNVTPAGWEYKGTYSTGTLYEDGNRKKGEFLSLIDSGIDENYVYLLVEDSVGPNSGTVVNPNFEYTFWYCEDLEDEISCTANGTRVSHALEYSIDEINRTNILNDSFTGPGGLEIMISTFRLAKWRDSFDKDGNRKREYQPLSNATFKLYLHQSGEELSTMISGLDGGSSYALAQSGAFRLTVKDAKAWPENSAHPEYANEIVLMEYEVEGGKAKTYVVTNSCVTFTDQYNGYTVYAVPVDLKEERAPEGYGYFSDPYQTYLCFVDQTPDSYAQDGTYRYYNDLYFVKTGGKDTTTPLAEDQVGRLWYVTSDNDSPVSFGNPQQRIVDYPMENTAVTIRKVGYVPTASTVTLSGTAGADYSEKIANGNYGAVSLANVEMQLQHKKSDGNWEDWDYQTNKPGTRTFTTDSSGIFFFPNGLKMGSYRVKEIGFSSDAPAEIKNKYENSYSGANDDRYRYFYVGGEAMTVYMSNPEKLALKLEKKNIVTSAAVSNMTFKLGSNLTAVETPENSGTYIFTNIPTGTYKLTESGGSLSTAYFALWFAKAYPDYAALVGNGMLIGYTYASKGEDNNKDVAITQISKLGTPVADLEELTELPLELTIQNPVKTTIKLDKYDLTDEEFKTKLGTAKFYVFYKPFTADAFTDSGMSVTIPTVPNGTTAENAVKAKFSGWTYKGTYQSAEQYFEQEPGVYAFVEYSTPAGYETLASGGNLVIYTAVLTGGLPVKVKDIPEKVQIGDYEVQTNYLGKDGSMVNVKARDPKMATMKATKIVRSGKLETVDRNWSVTLKVYETAAGGNVIASATITKTTSGAVQFKNGGNPVYFPVGKTYYLEEVVNTATAPYADAAHFKLITVKVDGSEITLGDGQTRYAITPSEAKEIAVEVTNQYLYGIVKFWKLDQSAKNALAGAEFNRVEYSTDDGNNWHALAGATVTGSSNPTYYTAKLPLVSAEATRYRIYETKAPDGCVINPDPTKQYIEVTLSAEDNYKDYAITISELNDSEYLTNPKGAPVTITKFNNVHGTDPIGYVAPGDATFGLYRVTGVDENGVKTVEFIKDQSVQQNGIVNFEGYLLVPGLTYAIAEIGCEVANYSGLESIYSGDKRLNLEDVKLGSTLIHNAYVFENKGKDLSFEFSAYNIPNVSPVIRKLDVGQYPDGAIPTMDFKVIELPARFDLASIDATKAAELAAIDNTTDTSKPRLVLQGSTSEPVEVTVEGIEGTVHGTTTQWSTNDIANRWDSAKNYLLVETNVGSKNAVYDTMVKDDTRVEWYKVIPAGVSPSNIDAFTLKNINGFADVKLTKTVVEHSDEEDAVASDIVGGSVGSLLQSSRKVAYTITPTVTGKNQMLTSFIVEEQGLTSDPVSDKFDYTIDQILVGRASQKTPAGSKISAEITFYAADGTTQVGDVKTIGDVTAVPADYSDPDNPVEAVTDPVPFNEIPSGAKRFKISYYSQAVMDLSDNDAYVLGEEFRAGDTTVLMTVKQMPDGDGTVEGAAVEIDKFTNHAYTELHYPKWGADGSAPVDQPRSDNASADVNVEKIQLPFVSIQKEATLANGEAPALTDTIISYTIESPANSGLVFKNPVVLDILPTGVKFKYDNAQYGITVNPTTISCEHVPVTGVIVPRIKEIENADAETAVLFKLTGDLAPQATVSITFYAYITYNAVAYEVPGTDQVKIQNDAYLSSAVHDLHTEANPKGYSFALGQTETGAYIFGEELATAASHDSVAKIHEEGVHGELSSDIETNNYVGDYYEWTRATHAVGVVKGNYLTTMKGVKGDKDPGFHDEGLGVASRTTLYADNEGYQDGDQGHVDWRLTINDGDNKDATLMVVGDVMAQVGDEENRGSAWNVVFDSITSVTFNGAKVNDDKYTMWYYTGEINGALSALKTAMPVARSWTAESHTSGWITQAELDAYPSIQSREGITAFIMVFDESVVLNHQHSAVITYHTIVKKVADDQAFAGIAFQNSTNDFYIYYNEYKKPTPSNTVSVTLMDRDVQVEGDVWIDENWDGTQHPKAVTENGVTTYENRRPYELYAIINELVGTADDPGINFSILDNRDAGVGMKNEDSAHGVNENPGYGESIRHFKFTGLGAALCWRTYEEYGENNAAGILNPGSLKGDDPFNYSLYASFASGKESLANIFKLTDLGAGHYRSDNPDTELTAVAANSLDDNFYSNNGSESSFMTHPFYIRYSDKWDQSKDIGFKMVRDLMISKVAQDDPNVTLKGAEFKIYGPFDEFQGTAASGEPLKFRGSAGNYTLDPNGGITVLETDANGKLKINGLNWWKEYIVEESKTPAGYSTNGATITTLDTAPDPEIGWTGRDSEAEGYKTGYKEFEVLENTASVFRFRLKLPATERTSSQSVMNVQVENPRDVVIPLKVQKELKSFDDSKYTFQFELRLQSITTLDGNSSVILNGLNSELLNKDPIETLNIEVDASKHSAAGITTALGSFEEVAVNGAGIYTFTITELKNVENFYGTYDEMAKKNAIVRVEWDNGAEDDPATKDVDESRKPGLVVKSIDYTDRVTVDGVDYERFINEYNPKPTKLQIPVYKTMSGNELPANTELFFDFELTGVADANGVMPEMPGGTGNKTTIKILPNASTSIEGFFGEIEFTVPGTYTYTVKENARTGGIYNRIVHDPASYTVTVTVVDDPNNHGTLTNSYVIKKNGTAVDNNKAIFTNKYEPTDISIQIPVEKKISGDSDPTKPETFIFKLEAVTTGAPMPTEKNPISITVENRTIPVSGLFGSITYTAAGTYQYKVTETEGSNTHYAYSEDEWLVTVVVEDKGGALSVTKAVAQLKGENGSYGAEVPLTGGDPAVIAITFDNPYTPEPITAVIPVAKTVTVTPEGSISAQNATATFNFTLTGVADADNVMPPMPTAANGDKVSITVTSDNFATGVTGLFGSIEYTAAGVYTYTVQEVEPADEDKIQGMTYITTPRTVTVTVTVDENDKLVAVVTEDGAAVNESNPVVVNNTYDEPHVDVKVEKIWNDDDDRDLIRPDYIEVTLYRNYTKVGETEVTKDEVETVTIREDPTTHEWKYTWTNLPKYMQMTQDITYSVEEAKITGPRGFAYGYVTKISDIDNAYGITITNTHEPQTTEFGFYKYGQVSENGVIQENDLPLEGVTFTLFTDPECTVKLKKWGIDGNHTEEDFTATSDSNGLVKFEWVFYDAELDEDGVFVKYLPTTFYMKETDLGSDENKDSYWDNDTIYKVVLIIFAALAVYAVIWIKKVMKLPLFKSLPVEQVMAMENEMYQVVRNETKVQRMTKRVV